MAEEKTTFTEQVGNEIERLAGQGETPPSPQQPASQRIDYTADEFLAEDYEEIPALFRAMRNGEYFPVIPLGVVGIIAGVGGSNKSTLLRQLAMCTAAGCDFNGWEYMGTHRSAIYVSTEDPKPVIKNFVKRMNESMNFSAEQLKGLRFVFSSEDIIAKLEERLCQHPADLIIIDAFASVMPGKEQNSASDTRGAIELFSSLAFKYNCTVILLHHTNKGTDKIPMSRDNFAGSQAFVNTTRFAIELRVDKVDKDLRLFGFVKHNYLPISFWQETAMALRLGNDFVLSTTGKYVPFEETGEIAPRREDRKYDKVLVDVLKVMRDYKAPMSYATLKNAIMDYRDKGERTAEKNIKHALEVKAILKNEREEYVISRDYE